jgi:hypothetical protein
MMFWKRNSASRLIYINAIQSKVLRSDPHGAWSDTVQISNTGRRIGRIKRSKNAVESDRNAAKIAILSN